MNRLTYDKQANKRTDGLTGRQMGGCYQVHDLKSRGFHTMRAGGGSYWGFLWHRMKLSMEHLYTKIFSLLNGMDWSHTVCKKIYTEKKKPLWSRSCSWYVRDALDQTVSILQYNLMNTWYRKSILYAYLTHILNGHKCGHPEYVTGMCKGYSSYTKYS